MDLKEAIELARTWVEREQLGYSWEVVKAMLDEFDRLSKDVILNCPNCDCVIDIEKQTEYRPVSPVWRRSNAVKQLEGQVEDLQQITAVLGSDRNKMADRMEGMHRQIVTLYRMLSRHFHYHVGDERAVAVDCSGDKPESCPVCAEMERYK